MLVEEGERKILECVERLSSVSYRNAAVVAADRDIKRAVFVLYGCAGHKPHARERAVEELRHLVGDGILDGDSALCFRKESALRDDFHVNLIF